LKVVRTCDFEKLVEYGNMAAKAHIVSIIPRFLLTSRDISCLTSDDARSCSSSRISTPTWKKIQRQMINRMVAVTVVMNLWLQCGGGGM